jgi:hypothetical protein
MFERCHRSGLRQTLDGKHERALCSIHGQGIAKALAQPEMFRVRWGLSSAEKAARDHARINALIAAYGEPPEGFTGGGTWIGDYEDAEYVAPTVQEEAWEWIESLRANIEDLPSDGPPIVRVEVGTR